MTGRCGNCGRTRDTRECSGRRIGNYRRASARIRRRVCREYCEARLAYVVVPENYAHLNESAFEWETAVRAFGIAIPSGTRLSRMAGRVEP